MSTPWWQIDWVWQATGWALAAAGVVLFLWALFWDRARGRKRCPKCWYDLSGAVIKWVGGTSRDREGAALQGAVLCVCPECGRKIVRERELARTRRRWGWACAAVLTVGVAAQVCEQPRRRMERWTKWIPTTLLVMVADLDAPTHTNALSHALWLRSSSLWPWHGAIVVFRRRVPSVEELQGVVITRRVWPADEKVAVGLVAPYSLRPVVGSQTLRAHVCVRNNAVSVESQMAAPDVGSVHRFVTRDPSVAALQLGTGLHTLVVTGELESEAGGFSWVVRRWTQTLQVEVVAELDKVVRGVSSSDLTSRIQSGFVAGTESGCTFMVWWSPDPYEPPPGGFRMALLRDGEEIDAGVLRDGSAFLCWDADRGATTWTRMSPPPELLRRLKMRISGDARSTLPQMNQDWYWSGSIDVPVSDLLDRREVQRAKRK